MSTRLRDYPPLSDEERGLLAEAMEERVERDGAKTAGQTMLSHADLCPRSGAFYLMFGGGTESHATARGTLAHLFDERVRDYMLESGDQTMPPPEVLKDWMQEMIGLNVELPLPESEQEALRIYAWNSHWARIDPTTLVCNEATLSLEIGGWTVRGRVDQADILPDRVALITDRKSGLHLPSQEDYASGPKSFQPKTYCLLFAEGVDENGMRPGEGLNSFRSRVELPRRINEDTGELGNREADYTRAELWDFKLGLERLLGVLDHGLETGEFPVATGSHCAYCPAASRCPIDAQYRTEPGQQGPPEPIPSIESMAAAQELGEEKLFIDARSSGIQKALREWSSDNGAVRVGDLEFDFGYQDSRSIKDWDLLVAAIQRASEFGEPFDLAEHVQIRRSTPYRKKKVTA